MLLELVLLRSGVHVDNTKTVKYPEFCKELSEKCSGHRINRGVQGIFEMHRSVVFFILF